MNKIDVVYTFHYDRISIKKAIQRLQCSIGSLINQDVRIIVINASKTNIAKYLKDFPIEYHHHPYGVTGMEKCVLINHVVKYFVQTPYFFVSDIDLVYPPDYIKKMLETAWDIRQLFKVDVRLIPYVINLQSEYYASNYNELLNSSIERYEGIAPGNGLICTRFFKLIRGYDERYRGYGPEDSNFNERISKVNLFHMENSIKTIHLYHPPSKNREQFEINTGYNNTSRQIFEQYGDVHQKFKPKINPENFYIIQVNKEKWGELE